MGLRVLAGFWERTALRERDWRLKRFLEGLRDKMRSWKMTFGLNGGLGF